MSDSNQQIVQFFRNKNILSSRQDAVNAINALNAKFESAEPHSDVGILDGEPVIIRYLGESNEVETYMAVAVEDDNGRYHLSNVASDVNIKDFKRIIDSASGDIYSKIEQTASSITTVVEDKLKGYTTLEQTADKIAAIAGEVLKSANSYYIVLATQPDEVDKDKDPIDYGWSLDYPDESSINDNKFVWTFTRYVYSNNNVVQTKIAKLKNGSDGVSLYTWIAYSDKGSESTECYDSPYDEKGHIRPYIGFAENQTSPKEEYIVSKYKWSEIKGEKGVSGDSGYIWILYADELDKQDGNISYPSVAYQQPKSTTVYIGILPNQKTENEETSEKWLKKYKWSKFRGDDGVGVTYYTWVKYSDSNSTENTIDTSLSDSPKKSDDSYYKYVGFGYNKLTAETEASTAETLNRSNYVWTVYNNSTTYKFIPVVVDTNVEVYDTLAVDIEFNVYNINEDKILTAFTDMQSAGLSFGIKDNINDTYTILDDNKYVNNEYQKRYHDIKDGEEVTTFTVSMWNGDAHTDETAIDKIISGVGYKKGAIRTFTQDMILDAIQDASGNSNIAESTVSSFTRTIRDIQGDVNTLKSTVDKNSATIKDVSGRTSQIEQTVSGISTNISDIDGRTSNIEQTVSDISTNISDIDGRTTKLEQSATGLTTTIQGVGDEINKIKIDINGLKTNKGISAQTLVTNSVNGGPYISISEGEINIYRVSSATTPSIRFGYSETNASGGTINSMVLAFYDNNGTLLYDLGPDGLVWNVNGTKKYGRPSFASYATIINLSSITNLSSTSTIENVYDALSIIQEGAFESATEIDACTFNSGFSAITQGNGNVDYTYSDSENENYLWTTDGGWTGYDINEWQGKATDKGKKIEEGWYMMQLGSSIISYKICLNEEKRVKTYNKTWTKYLRYPSVNNVSSKDAVCSILKITGDNVGKSNANKFGYYYTDAEKTAFANTQFGPTSIGFTDESLIAARIMHIDSDGKKDKERWIVFIDDAIRTTNDYPFNDDYQNGIYQSASRDLISDNLYDYDSYSDI